jgi:hypothetical protein
MLPLASPEEGDNASQQKLLAVLDEQIERLPKRYREALLLCRLGGKTHAQAAQELGCSAAVIGRRIASAEQLLRRRLNHCGLALSADALTAVLTQATEASAMPVQLPGETVRAALAFVKNTLAPTRAVLIAQGVLQAMASNKALGLWGVTMTALLCLGGAGLGVVA